MVPGVVLVSQNAFAEGSGHSDPIAPALLALFVVLVRRQNSIALELACPEQKNCWKSE
jgi:hypothetical protein